MDQRKKKLKLFDFEDGHRQDNILNLSNRHFTIGTLEMSSNWCIYLIKG